MNKENNTEDKVSFISKIKKSFGDSVGKIDSKTDPIVGKYLYLVFKWLTIAIFIIAIPLFILFYQMSSIEDKYAFSFNGVSYDGTNYDKNDYSKEYYYSDIDESIDLFYDSAGTEYGIFDDTIIDPATIGGSETEVYLFYGIFNGDVASQVSSQNITFMDYYTTSTDPLIMDSFTITYFEDTLNSMTITDEIINDAESAKTAMREIFIPFGWLGSSSSIETNGIIISWTLVGIATLSGALWYWFSKYSEVELKDKKNKEKVSGK